MAPPGAQPRHVTATVTGGSYGQESKLVLTIRDMTLRETLLKHASKGRVHSNVFTHDGLAIKRESQAIVSVTLSWSQVEQLLNTFGTRIYTICVQLFGSFLSLDQCANLITSDQAAPNKLEYNFQISFETAMHIREELGKSYRKGH